MINTRSIIFTVFFSALFFMSISCIRTERSSPETFTLPELGLCAHRGAMATHPENTIPAFQAAIDVGAQMIEFDVKLTADKAMVVIHDATVDRTTNGSGRVTNLTLDQIRQLDAGSWKDPVFKGILVPTLDEVLEVMPINIWLNVHINQKEDDVLGAMVAERLEAHNRLHQAFIACGAGAAAKAREAVPDIMICNMDRRQQNQDYVRETIEMDAAFIQLRGEIYPEFALYARELKDNGVRINYFGTDEPEVLRTLFVYGIDFPLVDNIVQSIHVATEVGIQPVQAKWAQP
jgi:glycerophosphoryl diester phosphodiesterase